MSLPITLDTTDTALPIPQALTDVLLKEIERAYITTPPQPTEDPLFGITLVFRDPGYDPLLGGYHPVEIRLGRANEHYRLDYLTDFSYVGPADQAELQSEINFEFGVSLCVVRYLPPIALSRVGEFFDLYVTNFLSYYRNGAYEVEVVWEN
ncbi:DUF2787 family protein [Billgrantia montanilacus]|nr:DUF2787 family protein [Halomonas montanilacus]